MGKCLVWTTAILLLVGFIFLRETTDIITRRYDAGSPASGDVELRGAMRRDGSLADIQGRLSLPTSDYRFPPGATFELDGLVAPDGSLERLGGRVGMRSFDYGFWSILPPLLTLVLAFGTKQVVPALLAGVVAGGIVSGDYNIVSAYFMPALGSLGYAQILLVYLWCLGGLIGLWTKTGGAELFARWAAGHIVRGRRSAKFFAYLMGLIFHQGGTISTILAGTTVRPVCDEEKVSHEELSYIIDSTASPVATLIPLNVWPMYTGGMIIGTAAFLTTMDEAVAFFWRAIPFNFYAMFALLFTLLTSLELMPWYGRRMRLAMERVKTTGALDADGAVPLTSKELSTVRVPHGYRPGLEDFFIPLGTLIGIAAAGLFLTGTPAVNEAFFSAVMVAILVAIFKGMPMVTTIDGFIEGCKGVTIGAVILGLAVTLKEVADGLGTAHYIVAAFSGVLPALILPASFLFICMFISFSTGTSFGTYAVVLPLTMPLAVAVAAESSLSNPELFITLCFGAVLGGAVYGDNCSPISDTTILSSVATGADLMDHVYSQLPMATAAAGVAAIAYTFCAMLCY